LLTVAVVGGGPQTTAELLEMASNAFAALTPRRVLIPALQSRRDTPRDTAIFRREATQVSIVARLPGVPRNHPDRRALELLNYIVGVPSYGGRLGWALTKTGLTYAAAARTHFAANVGEISFTTTADTRNASATIQAIREVIAGIGANGVEEWELREAQAFTLGRTTLYGAREDSSPDAIATALLESETSGLDQLDLPALSRAYLAVTLEQINRVAQMYYRPELLAVSATGAMPPRGDTGRFPAGTFRAIFEP
jgi:predicted Zn-dependent peptidase